MTTIDRYIGRALMANLALALGGFVLIFSVISLMEELRWVGEGTYTLGDATWFAMLRLPAESFELFPAAALVGCVMGLSRMAAQGELIAMQASGLSFFRIAVAAMQAAALAAAAMMLFGEIVAAPLARTAHVERTLAVSGGRALTSATGFWTRSESAFINVRNPHTDGSLDDVLLLEFDEANRLRRYARARSAHYSSEGWRLTDVVETTITAEGTEERRVASESWDRLPPPRAVQSMLLPAEDMSVAELWSTSDTLHHQGILSHRYDLAFWKRVTTPVVAIVMIAIAIPLVLESMPRRQHGRAVVLAALAGVGFQMVNQTFGTLAVVYRLPPLLGATAPGVVALLVGIWKFRRLR